MNASMDRRQRQKPFRSVVASIFLLAGAALSTEASAIFRCEESGGRVTYSNLPCPASARSVRRVDDSPPIVVHGDAQAGQTTKPNANAEQVSAASAVASAHVPSRIEATRVERTRDPIEEDRRITAQYNAQKRECEQRARRLQFLQEDLRAASPVTRSSAELALRRAQNEYQQSCPRQR